MINYNIISTGSKGNAVVINDNILIDCGVPFKALRDVYSGLKLVLLTHIHSDHFNRATIKRLAQERPTLRWGCHKWLLPDVANLVPMKNIDVYTIGHCFIYPRLGTIKPDKSAHNVPNCSYHIWMGTESLFYATDTNSLDGVEANNYDLYMVEANYTEAEIVERIRYKQAAGEYCHEWDVLQNHLSKEKADNWLYQNMGPKSSYIYMHEHEDKNLSGMGCANA